jgi:hypothetical protein
MRPRHPPQKCFGREAAPQLKSEAASAAADIEHRAVARQVGAVDQDLREAAGPAPEEALVGGPVIRPAGVRSLERVSRSQP